VYVRLELYLNKKPDRYSGMLFLVVAEWTRGFRISNAISFRNCIAIYLEN